MGVVNCGEVSEGRGGQEAAGEGDTPNLGSGRRELHYHARHQAQLLCYPGVDLHSVQSRPRGAVCGELAGGDSRLGHHGVDVGDASVAIQEQDIQGYEGFLHPEGQCPLLLEDEQHSAIGRQVIPV